MLTIILVPISILRIQATEEYCHDSVFGVNCGKDGIISKESFLKWLNINAVKEYTSLSISKIRRSVANGQLKSSKKAGRLLFKITWIEKWLNS